MDAGIVLCLTFMAAVAAVVFFPKVREPLARRLARDETDVPRLMAQGDTLVLFMALLTISVAVSSMIGIRVLFGGSGTLVPTLLTVGFFTFLALGLVGPSGLKTSGERIVQIPTRRGKQVVMEPHRVEAVNAHHVDARRALSWMMLLAAVLPWAVLFAHLVLHGALGTPAQMPPGFDVG